GFEPNRVLTIPLLASRSTYASGAPVVDAYARYVAAIRAVPGVASAAATGAPPLSAGADQSGVRFPSSPTNTGQSEHDNVLADNAPITARYLEAMGIALLEGREFDGSETDTTLAKVAVIDELLAKRYFPKGSAVGQTVLVDGTPLRVVGVARHFRMYNYE